MLHNLEVTTLLNVSTHVTLYLPVPEHTTSVKDLIMNQQQ